MKSISLPGDARFSCQSCGRCCQGWVVPVDQATVDRLRKHDWGGDPFEATPGQGVPYRTRLVNGRCFFLDADNHCRIHNEISYDAKPVACRSFPLAVLEVEGKQYARLSYWCPTVTANAGKPIDHQMRWVRDIARHSDQRVAPLMLDEKTPISSRDFDRVQRSLLAFIGRADNSIGERLAACASLIRRLQAVSASGVPSATAIAIEEAETQGVQLLAEETRRGGRAGGGRRVLSLYLMQDRKAGRIAIAARFVSILLFNAGLIRIRSQVVSGRASWREIRRVALDFPPESDALLTRYITSKVDSRRYLAGEATLVTGLNLLVAAYGMIVVLARMRAVSQSRQSCNEEDVRMAVEAADFLVVEHPSLHQGAVQRRLVETALGGQDLCGDLLVCLEE